MTVTLQLMLRLSRQTDKLYAHVWETGYPEGGKSAFWNERQEQSSLKNN